MAVSWHLCRTKVMLSKDFHSISCTDFISTRYITCSPWVNMQTDSVSHVQHISHHAKKQCLLPLQVTDGINICHICITVITRFPSHVKLGWLHALLVLQTCFKLRILNHSEYWTGSCTYLVMDVYLHQCLCI